MPRSLGLRIGVSALLALLIASLLVLVVFVVGWLDFSADLSNAEIGIGILVVVVTGAATGAVAQALSTAELGPEVLLGPLLVLAGFVIVAQLISDRAPGLLWSGGLPVAIGQAKLGMVGTRVAWTLRS